MESRRGAQEENDEESEGLERNIASLLQHLKPGARISRPPWPLGTVFHVRAKIIGSFFLHFSILLENFHHCTLPLLLLLLLQT